jgi:GAF domain-containing protein
VVVDDVKQDPRYLACNLETQSEIVVPIMSGGTYLAQIDIDSDHKGAFGPPDRAFLTKVASIVSPLFPTP